jgi:hypothetical protein
MAAVSETIVREYFELHGFFVRQQRKYVAPSRSEDEEIDFLVWNPLAETPVAPLPVVLASTDLHWIARAVVVVRGWHTEIFSTSRLANSPELFRFLEPAILQQAGRAFGGQDGLFKILVVPALPQGDESRRQSIELLRQKGIDAVLQFRTVLADLVTETETNRNYQKSDLLQVIRVLKNYEFFREPQLELFKAGRKRKKTETGGHGSAGE